LGRPLGSAEDPEFQKDVMRQAFGLLATATEPTIADYAGPLPEEAGPGQWACPLNLGPVVDDTLTGRLIDEVWRCASERRSRSWHRPPIFGPASSKTRTGTWSSSLKRPDQTADP
jgi:hypothetical protein